MNENQIRHEVRLVLKELRQQFAGAKNFPYKTETEIVTLPEDINTQEDYLVNWNNASTNKDVQDFPIEEFQKGLQVERAKRKVFNIMHIAEIVIDKLKENPHFYSNLGVN